MQVVNGSQTIHALFEAFKDDSTKFESIDLLCRIYETRNEDLSTNIAEYTNSQNPVKSRDIRSNDYIQKKLEKELEVLGYFYERKKAQHSRKPKDKRLDAEKVGQALLAFYNLMPAEAKDKKRIIFAEKYDDIFSDSTTAEAVLLAVDIFNYVEEKKSEQKKKILNNLNTSEEDISYILHSTYYIIYMMSVLAEREGVEKVLAKKEEILSLYDEANQLIRNAVKKEKESLEGYKENYTHRIFLKGNRPKIGSPPLESW